ncbi:serine/threonine protein phosphatase [Flavobacterium sp. K77]|uniref:Serine/threonine protein phosphatase n=1 Tax=Flavobacterium turcicum TaxID=2764718 RepID=A0ABR7JC49_9FLAO|nr:MULTISPECIES: metallophosphoesterase family protein [Flavobacterium]MBC5862081.1 serine/threonine protein phosphatase [Flavobacterium turcicum]MCF6139863.1 serine/threonine protein phosphatase [Flavobacterium sp. K77]NHL00812.1 serine/threonine protein phosphatase [Flavobacterium turcicum]
MRTLVIGDIHGGLRALHQIMERAKVTKHDTLIFLGDYVDGWSQSPQVLDFIIDLQSQQNCICIRGNHDDLLLEWLDESKDNLLWYKHGGEATVKAYESVTYSQKQKHIEFLKSLKNYYLDEHNRLYVHAGFTNVNGAQFEYFPGQFYWDRTLWETALSLDDRMALDHPFYPKRLSMYHEIFIGHTPVTRIGETTPVKKANVWNVDTGAAFKGPLTILDVDTKEFWQSEPLNQLYFDEKGRN